MNQNHIVFRAGKRIYLRPLLKEDLQELVVWINDPEITQFLKATYPLSHHHEEKWYEKVMQSKGEDVTFVIALQETHELVGIMGLHKINQLHQRACTGSVLGKKFWGLGYGTEAKMLVLEYAFNTLNLRKICSEVYATNPRSKRCLEKCGYREEGVLKEHVFKNGSFVDVYQMAVFRDSFLKLWAEYKVKFLT